MMRLALSALLLLTLRCAPPNPCREGQVAEARAATTAPVAHAHNDYEHPLPLDDALAAGFTSVEADLFYADGRFDVKHGVFERAKGTLEDLYLAPLQARVREKGSVLGDGRPFTLWLDLKDSDARITAALRTLLESYSTMLTRADDTAIQSGPVTAVLTGDAGAKGRVVDGAATRYAFRDSNVFTPEDPPADLRWRYYALDWNKYVGWGGDAEMPAEVEQRLGCLIQNAHAAGRQVRFYNHPDREAVWGAQRRHGVDFIGTDKLTALEGFFQGP